MADGNVNFANIRYRLNSNLKKLASRQEAEASPSGLVSLQHTSAFSVSTIKKLKKKLCKHFLSEHVLNKSTSATEKR